MVEILIAKKIDGMQLYFKTIFVNMFIGLLISALSAFLVVSTGLVHLFLTPTGLSPLAWMMWIGLFVFVIVFQVKILKMPSRKARMLFFVYSALTGASLSLLGIAFSLNMIFQAFIVTSLMFGGMAMWGFRTKKNLQPLGMALFMGMIGLVIVSVLQIFFHNPLIYLIVNLAGVVIFSLFTAYDMQALKNIYNQLVVSDSDHELISRAGIMGSLTLYMSFINLFIYMLRLMSSLGNR
ncbi:MAG: Bax inhibitor-1/YccA family protein [Alphaproteobacteria bacterium]|nr:Bax inhibitor-1/YccA family protein [Alphaproteobacteria bacterium]MBL0717689.1 Bax inhibitor-1/YccA family protein [Alphaproteobacteria bacterium]